MKFVACVLSMALVSLPAFGTAAESRASDSEANDSAMSWSRGPDGEDLGTVAVAWIQEDDPNGERLHGIRLEAGSWDETADEFKLAGGFWLSGQHGGSQRVFDGGLNIGWVFCRIGPVRVVLPQVKAGLEHRRRPPHDGFGGVLGVGIDAGIWIARRAELAVVLAREFEFPAGTRNQIAFVFRWGSPGLRWWPKNGS